MSIKRMEPNYRKKRANRQMDKEQAGSEPMYYSDDQKPSQLELGDLDAAGSADPMEWSGNWMLEDPNDHFETSVSSKKDSPRMPRQMLSKMRKKGYAK